ncbi:hypothetical protein ACIP79_27520 [Streptomyces sp. NPDC088747]|uniref:MmyB family transcriptional regulator n=1 Tax=Streptomyces sp. NPDC088747 TaxID=3365886 RepID=UPI003814A3F6
MAFRAASDGPRFQRRASSATPPGDGGIEGLVTELLGTSPRFAEMWATHDVEVRRRVIRKIDSATFGPLDYECPVRYSSECTPGSPGVGIVRTPPVRPPFLPATVSRLLFFSPLPAA